MNKQLQRSTQNKVIGGVCAGIAHYFGLDPVLVRVGFLIALLAFGVGPLVYLVLWVVMPASSTY
ncbi:MAG TPA: PspC domain-containing protein [Chloroflexota bacterium]|nr:PspC domain-containing protein [Chloroflexota bacterium]